MVCDVPVSGGHGRQGGASSAAGVAGRGGERAWFRKRRAVLGIDPYHRRYETFTQWSRRKAWAKVEERQQRRKKQQEEAAAGQQRSDRRKAAHKLRVFRRRVQEGSTVAGWAHGFRTAVPPTPKEEERQQGDQPQPPPRDPARTGDDPASPFAPERRSTGPSSPITHSPPPSEPQPSSAALRPPRGVHPQQLPQHYHVASPLSSIPPPGSSERIYRAAYSPRSEASTGRAWSPRSTTRDDVPPLPSRGRVGGGATPYTPTTDLDADDVTAADAEVIRALGGGCFLTGLFHANLGGAAIPGDDGVDTMSTPSARPEDAAHHHPTQPRQPAPPSGPPTADAHARGGGGTASTPAATPEAGFWGALDPKEVAARRDFWAAVKGAFSEKTRGEPFGQLSLLGSLDFQRRLVRGDFRGKKRGGGGGKGPVRPAGARAPHAPPSRPHSCPAGPGPLPIRPPSRTRSPFPRPHSAPAGPVGVGGARPTSAQSDYAPPGRPTSRFV